MKEKPSILKIYNGVLLDISQPPVEENHAITQKTKRRKQTKIYF